jgi:hypothetical protein
MTWLRSRLKGVITWYRMAVLRKRVEGENGILDHRQPTFNTQLPILSGFRNQDSESGLVFVCFNTTSLHPYIPTPLHPCFDLDNNLTVLNCRLLVG